MDAVLIQPHHTANGNRLQVADQRLDARQATRAAGNEQNIAGVMGDRLRYRVQRGGEGEMTRQHRLLHFAEVNMQRHREEVKRR